MPGPEPSADDALDIFKSIEAHFPSQSLGGDKWYILALAAMTAGGYPEFAANVYLYLLSKPEYSTPETRKALVRRLREALVKLVSIVGVPKPLEAVFSIAGVEREEDKEYSFSRSVYVVNFFAVLDPDPGVENTGLPEKPIVYVADNGSTSSIVRISLRPGRLCQHTRTLVSQ